MKSTPIAQLGHEWLPLVDKALAARRRAHAPYSRFQVGSCVEDEHGTLHTGCNVENASFAGTVCAERTAVVKMVSEGGRHIRRVVVVASAKEPCFPCGFCLQMLREFGTEFEVVALDQEATVFQHATMRELFPYSFGAEQLPGTGA